jgi:hypothetical protein
MMRGALAALASSSLFEHDVLGEASGRCANRPFHHQQQVVRCGRGFARTSERALSHRRHRILDASVMRS